MANSIIGGNQPSRGNPSRGPVSNQNMIQQLLNFKQQLNGDPRQMVMQMLSKGQINNNQLQQAMQMAKQFQGLIK